MSLRPEIIRGQYAVKQLNIIWSRTVIIKHFRSFDECGFSPEVKELIVRSGYDDPTPIQTVHIFYY